MTASKHVHVWVDQEVYYPMIKSNSLSGLYVERVFACACGETKYRPEPIPESWYGEA